jgi:hypothetical protein
LDYSNTVSPGEYMTKCEDIIKMTLKELAVDCPLAQNTNQWQKLLNSVKNIRMLKMRGILD